MKTKNNHPELLTELQKSIKQEKGSCAIAMTYSKQSNMIGLLMEGKKKEMSLLLVKCMVKAPILLDVFYDSVKLLEELMSETDNETQAN